nr:hypothetical protein [Micromonospora sp. DSM 115978]
HVLGFTARPDDQFAKLALAFESNPHSMLRTIVLGSADRDTDTKAARRLDIVFVPDGERAQQIYFRHTSTIQVAEGISSGARPNILVVILGPGITAHSGLLAGLRATDGTLNAAKMLPGGVAA